MRLGWWLSSNAWPSRKNSSKRVSLSADDVWLKVVETIADVPVVAATADQLLDGVPDAQHVALCYSNLDDGDNDVILNSLLGDLEDSGVQPEPFDELVRDDSLDVFPRLWGCLGGPWYESAVEHLESKRATSFDAALLVCYDMRLRQSVCGFNRRPHSCQ